MADTGSASARLRLGKAEASSRSAAEVPTAGCHGASASPLSVSRKAFRSAAASSGAKRRRSCRPLGSLKHSSWPSLPSPSRVRSAVVGLGTSAATACSRSSRQRARLSSASFSTRFACNANCSARALYSGPLSARSAAGRKSTRTSCMPRTPACAGILAARISWPASSSSRATKTGSSRATAPQAPCSSTGTESPAVSAGMGASAACRALWALSPTTS
mmetsp:Transcript_75004/g.242543  ORF Transcript_75004/g.242543 Transcript_75004/m.242543 type:complete len:218 (-) Transcript_75004:902-1555(-)